MEGAIKNVWPFLIWGSYSEIKIKEGAGGESSGEERKNGEEGGGKKERKVTCEIPKGKLHVFFPHVILI